MTVIVMIERGLRGWVLEKEDELVDIVLVDGENEVRVGLRTIGESWQMYAPCALGTPPSLYIRHQYLPSPSWTLNDRDTYCINLFNPVCHYIHVVDQREEIAIAENQHLGRLWHLPPEKNQPTTPSQTRRR